MAVSQCLLVLWSYVSKLLKATKLVAPFNGLGLVRYFFLYTLKKSLMLTKATFMKIQ